MGPATLNIQDLPEEVFEIIAGFLPGGDLDACFNVCRKWRRILNNDKLWKKCCKYPEKYFKLSSYLILGRESCKWRQHFCIQHGIWENWRRGRFITDKSGIYLANISCLMDFVDDYGIHWLFDSWQNGISVWNITNTPVFQCHYNQNDHFGIWPLQDKVLTCRSNYVKVFQFKHPDYQLRLSYRFKFERCDVLPECEVVPDDDYVSGVRYILVDNQYYIGYNQNITDIQSAVMHIWDINKGSKVTTQNVYQQSFVDFITAEKGSDVTDRFHGGLLLFAGDNGRFLVNLIDDRFKLCHISLFSLVEMRFVKVVAQLVSRTAWCFVKGDIAVIFHLLGENSSQISVYNISINGGFLAKLDFPAHHNPAFSDEFWFGGSKVILKVNKNINVLTIIDSVKVRKSYFKLDRERFILKFFDPKFLLLFDRGCHYSSQFSISVWDIDSGAKLWKLRNVTSISLYRQMLSNSEHPGRLLVHFRGDREISILNFEPQMVNEHKLGNETDFLM